MFIFFSRLTGETKLSATAGKLVITGKTHGYRFFKRKIAKAR